MSARWNAVERETARVRMLERQPWRKSPVARPGARTRTFKHEALAAAMALLMPVGKA